MLDLLSSTSHYHLPKHSLVIRTFNEKAQRFKKSLQMQVVYKRKKKNPSCIVKVQLLRGPGYRCELVFFFLILLIENKKKKIGSAERTLTKKNNKKTFLCTLNCSVTVCFYPLVDLHQLALFHYFVQSTWVSN